LGAAPVSPTTGHLTLNGGTLLITGATTLNANRGIALDAAGGTISGTANTNIAGQITGTGGLTAISTALTSLTLSGDNTYQGDTIVSANTNLVAAHANALGSTAAGTTVQNDGTLQINNVHIGNEAITLNGS